MIDTIKMLIPLESLSALKSLETKLTRTRRENLKTDQLEFQFYTGNFETATHKRQITFKSSESPIGLFIELSIPKYIHGNNIEMLYPHEIPEALEKLRVELSTLLESALPEVRTWQVYRLDLCFNWTFESEKKCQSLMNFLQRIDFPRKKKYLYDTSVMYKGSAYSIKFYLKGVEYLKHDHKTIMKQDDIKGFYLAEWSANILRFEVEFRHAYLKELFGLKTVTIGNIAEDTHILEIEKMYLDKVFKYINRETMNSENILQRLQSAFTPAKALRLYQFYKGYYYQTDEKHLIEKGLDRSTIYRYKKDLKDAGINFTEELGDEEILALDELTIPSDRAKFTLPDYHAMNSK